jgi:CDP-diacylglycerol--glycerol-3-phosphate 3-phosphatidyltransferase
VSAAPARSGTGGPASRAQHRWHALPNWLSAFRLASAPVIGALLLIDANGLRFFTAVLFAVAAITDYLDGFLARRWKVVSTLGVFIDLAADKILVSTVLIVLVGTGAVPSWMAAVIVAREFIIAGLRSQAAATGLLISASMLGKWKTTVTLVALLAALLYPMHSPPVAVQVGLWAATVITVASAVDYIARFWQVGVKT